MEEDPGTVGRGGRSHRIVFCEHAALVWILIAVMTIDYVTGLICGAMGKSQKTETGYLASHAAFIGLLKKR